MPSDLSTKFIDFFIPLHSAETVTVPADADGVIEREPVLSIDTPLYLFTEYVMFAVVSSLPFETISTPFISVVILL